MKDTVILVQPSSAGRVKVVKLTLEDDTVDREWGLLNGAMSSTSNTYGYTNRGRSNELSPIETAQADYTRLTEQRVEEGYRKVADLEEATLQSVVGLDTIDFDSPPKSFSPAKPIREIKDRKLQKLLDEGNILATKKADGLCHLIFIGGEGNVKIFTRRMDDHTSKYPDLVSHIKSKGLPPRTVLNCEFLVSHPNHTQAFQLMQGISKSDTSKGIPKSDLTRTKELIAINPVRALVFDILYLAAENTGSKAYRERYGLICTSFKDQSAKELTFSPEIIEAHTKEEIDEALNQYSREGGEGLVLWDLSSPTEVSFTGKPKRRNCYKRKLVLEDDVIAYEIEEGTGRHQGKVGALLIGKYNGAGEIVPMGKVGSGLKDNERDLNQWEVPVVIQIEYSVQFDTGCYQFPIFKRVHGDKTPEDIRIT